MKVIWRNLCQYSKNFWQHWISFMILFVGMDLANQLIFIPLFRLAATYILQAGGIPFISYQNIGILLTQHTMVVVGLLIELVLLLLVIYWQFACLLLGLRLILRNQISFSRLMKESWQALRNIRPGSLPLMLLYFILVLPFVDLVFRTPLLSKVQIPEFIVDFMTRSNALLGGLIFFYVMITILGIRLILTLPLMIYQHHRTRDALVKSWQLTGGLRWWQYIKRLLILVVVTTASLLLFYLLIFGLQSLMDLFPGKLAFTMAVVNLTLIQGGSELLTIWTGIIALQIVTSLLDNPSVAESPEKNKWRALTLISLLVVIGGSLSLVNNYYYLKGSGLTRPLTISHRGVAEENGVQNTIPAMEKTHRLHPTYVEMDIHETKDHQFVVLHDENLKKLTGVNKTPHELTLAQLTRLTAHENGYQAKIASFDQYLNAAERLHQKLLIEIKTTPADSKGMLQRFNRQYGQRIIKDHDLVHSLDYRVVTGLKRLNPKLRVLYIQPYNFSYPKSVADGYSMKYSTLNFEFIRQAHHQKDLVYSWTVNEPNVMMQMMYNQVDGIITDNLGELNSTIKDYLDSKSYANRILNFILAVPIKMIVVSDEEKLHMNSETYDIIADECRGGAYGFNLEGAKDDPSHVGTHNRGGMIVDVAVHGRAAHSGAEPEKGRSAVIELAHQIIKLSALSDLQAGVHVNCGVIKGGTSENIIPDQAKTSLGVRFKTNQQRDELLRKIKSIAATPTIPDTTTTVKVRTKIDSMEETPAVNRLFANLNQVAQQIGYGELQSVGGGGASDAGIMVARGVPTIDALGVVGNGAHSEEE